MNPNRNHYRPGCESIDQPLWDSATVPSPECDGASDRVALFRKPIGSVDVRGEQKTSAHTNMVMSGRLPQLNEYLIRRITLIVPDADDKDRMSFYWCGELMLAIGSKRYLTLPLVRLVLAPYELSEPHGLLIPDAMLFGVDVVFGHAPVYSRPLRFVVEIGGVMYRRVE
jgi:hypothetical protein